MSEVLERIIASGRKSPLLNLSAEDVAIVRKAFADNPPWCDLYLFYDKRVAEGEAFRGRMSSRTAQLTSIATDGVPMHITRIGFKRWHPDPNSPST